MELHTGKLARLFVYALLGAAAFSVAAPLALMILNSLRSNFDILISPLGWPSEPEWGVFVRVWKEAQLGQAIINSLVIAAAHRGDRLHHLLDGRLGDRASRGAGLDDGQPLFPGDHHRADPDVHVPAVLHDGEARPDQQPDRGDHHLFGDLHAVLAVPAAHLRARRADGARGGGAHRRRLRLAGLHQGDRAADLARPADGRADRRA